MSWDIFVQDLPRAAMTVDEIPDEFKPAPIGKRSAIIEGIKEVLPTADFSKPGWGIIDGGGWAIDVNIGDEENCTSFALHVRGGDAAVGAVAVILDRLKLRALDSGTGGFFFADAESLASFHRWRAYRGGICNTIE